MPYLAAGSMKVRWSSAPGPLPPTTDSFVGSAFMWLKSDLRSLCLDFVGTAITAKSTKNWANGVTSLYV